MAAPLVKTISQTFLRSACYQGPLSLPTSLVSSKPFQKCLGGNTGTACSSIQRSFTHWSNHAQANVTTYTAQKSSSLLQVCQPFVNSVRTAVRYSLRKGKPKTVKAVVSRFFRLPWGIYIRTRAGRHKKKHIKPDWINERGRYHVFCNKTQSRMFDKMVTQGWKKRRYYANDPYEPYMKRTGMGDYTPPKFLP